MTNAHRMKNLTRSKLLRAARTFRAPKGYRVDRAAYYVQVAGRYLPSKALVGRATGLRPSQFSGGIAHVGRVLRRLGFALVKVTRRVALLACSAAKLDRAARAADLYVGDFFRKAADWAARHADGLMVLSAKHGLLGADDVVAPYDQRLRRSDRAWVAATADALRRVDEGTLFVVFAGSDYVQAVEAAGVPFENPTAGLGLGRKKQWLLNNL